jgi:hypothetical protein
MRDVDGHNIIFRYTTFQKLVLLPLSDECGFKPMPLQPLDEANLSPCNLTDPTELVLQHQCYEHSHTADYCVQFISSGLS